MMQHFTPTEAEQSLVKGQLPWVKVTRFGLLETSRLLSEAPVAGQLLFAMIAAMDKSNAIVASYSVLADLTGRSVSTVRRAVAALDERNLIEIIHLQDRGAANLYKVHDRIAWVGSGRGRHAAVSARVLVRGADQPVPSPDERALIQLDFEALGGFVDKPDDG